MVEEDAIRAEVDAAAHRVLSAYLGLPRDRRPEVDWQVDDLRDAALGSDRRTARRLIAAWEVSALAELWGDDPASAGAEVLR